MKKTPRIRVLCVFGTRPEAIKMAPVVKALVATSEIDCKVLVTAQHRTMLDQVLTLFHIEPDFDLDIMQANQDLYDVTARILLGMREPLRVLQPDLVLVHGDTTTCLAAGLAAFYQGIPVGHVEAGLRTGNLHAPFPEEANRTLIARLASLHFAPTLTAKNNLLRENVDSLRIVVTGNTVIDALLWVKSQLPHYTPSDWTTLPARTLSAIQYNANKIILITGHRRENFGSGFVDFCTAIKQIATLRPNWLLVYPVHLNPNVQRPVYQMLSGCSNVHLIEPQDYLPFVWLLDQCSLVITDSGGIQEEAPALGKPVLVTRNVTERPEAIDAGTVRLVGTAPDKIVQNTLEILETPHIYRQMSEAHNPYGDGAASGRIVQAILGDSLYNQDQRMTSHSE